MSTDSSSSTSQFPPSPVVPGAWPNNDTPHLGHVACFHQRLSLDLAPDASKLKSQARHIPVSCSMPGSFASASDDSQSNWFAHDTTTSLSAFSDMSVSTTPERLCPDPPLNHDTTTSLSAFSDMSVSTTPERLCPDPPLKLFETPASASSKIFSRDKNDSKFNTADTVSSSQFPFQPTDTLQQTLPFRPNSLYPSCERTRHQRPSVVPPISTYLRSDSPSSTPSGPSVPSPDVSLPRAPSSPVSLTFSSSSSPSPSSPASPEPMSFSSPSSSQFFPTFPLPTPPRSRHSGLLANASNSDSSYANDSPSPSRPMHHDLPSRGPFGYPLLQTSAPFATDSSEVVDNQPMLTSLSLPESISDLESSPISVHLRPSLSLHSQATSSPSHSPIPGDWMSTSTNLPSPMQLASLSLSASPQPSQNINSQHNKSYGSRSAASPIPASPLPSLPRSPVVSAPSACSPLPSSTANSPIPSFSASFSNPTTSPLVFASPTVSPLLTYSHYDDSKTTAAEYAAAIMDSSAWAFGDEQAADLGMSVPSLLGPVAGEEATVESANILSVPFSQTPSRAPSVVFAPSIRNLPVLPPTSVIGKMKRLGGKVKRFFVPKSRHWSEGGFERGSVNVNIATGGNGEISDGFIDVNADRNVVRGPTGAAQPVSQLERPLTSNAYHSGGNSSLSTGLHTHASVLGLQTRKHATQVVNPPNKRTLSLPMIRISSPSPSTMPPIAPPLSSHKVLVKGKGKAKTRRPTRPVISHPRRLSLSGLADYNPHGYTHRLQEESSSRSDNVDKALSSPPGLDQLDEGAKKQNRRFSLSALTNFRPPTGSSCKAFDSNVVTGLAAKVPDPLVEKQVRRHQVK